MSHDLTLRSAALLLRKGHPPDVLLGALDDETAWGMLVALLARPALSVRAAQRFAEAELRLRAEERDQSTAHYLRRRDWRRARGEARPGSCVDLETWGEQTAPCTCCDGWRELGALERCPCHCATCNDVAEHLAGCQRCPGDPCSGYMAERLGLVTPRSGT